MEFNYIRSASKDEQVRAWCVEQTINSAQSRDASGEEIIAISKMIEHYVTTGELTPEVIRSVYDEGASEARFQVKEAAEAWDDTIDLEELFKHKGWIRRA